VLSILIERAQNEGLLTGLCTDFVEKGIAILQYADDTVLPLQNDLHQARNLKILLCLFTENKFSEKQNLLPWEGCGKEK
jgi:hypothetical protein